MSTQAALHLQLGGAGGLCLPEVVCLGAGGAQRVSEARQLGSHFVQLCSLPLVNVPDHLRRGSGCSAGQGLAVATPQGVAGKRLAAA